MSIDNDPRFQELQAMHEREIVSRESIIAWYRWVLAVPIKSFADDAPGAL
ncbi:MAG: hypothetical protein ABIH42_05485 [Planctomycetota bacterium]